MHRRTLFALALALLGILANATGAAAAGSPAGTTTLLVKLRPGHEGAAPQVLGAAGAQQRAVIAKLGVRVVDVAAGRAAAARATLGADARVAFAEPDAIALAQENVPDDPYFPPGSLALMGGAWGWYRSHTTQAWDVTMGKPSVVVAVLDTGLKAQAQDFGGQLVPGYNVLDGSSDTSSGAGNHGTYVAGVVGLAANTGSGNAGYCPGCRVMPVQVGTDAGATYSDMATGLVWAVDHGARVANLSWAGTTASSTLASAVAYARSQGAVVFAAAGNSNCDCPTYPSATPGVIGVGGAANSGTKAGDSNFGSWVSVAAPEGNMTAWPTINGAPGFGQVGGTSLASPAAAGIAGLLFSANETLTGAQVESALTGSAKPASFTLRYGEVDAMAALQAIGFSDPQPATIPVNTVAPRLLIQTNGDQNNAPLTAAPKPGDVLVRGQGAWRGSSPLTLSAVRWERCQTDATGCVAVGSSYRYTVQSADAGFALRLTVTFTDPLGSTSATTPLSAAVGGATPPPPPPPPPPSSTVAPSISGIAQEGQTLSSSTGTWANTPTAYAYEWRRCDATGASCTPLAAATTASYTAVAGDVGATLRVAVTATNAAGSATAVSNPTAQIAPRPSATQTLTYSGSLSAKTPTRSFTVTSGAGATTARLEFSKCGSLTLALGPSGGGSTLATATGPSVLALDRTLAAGSYAYTVSGSTRCSFTLTVTTPAP